MRLHAFQHGVEVVGIDLDELAVLQLGKRLLGLAGEVAQDAHDEGQFLDFDGAADFDVVGDLHAGRTHAVEFMLRALFCHDEILRRIL